MGAVRDVVDRDVLDGTVGEHRLPHPTRHLAVEPADAVSLPAEANRERSHPGRLALVVGARAAERDELRAADAEPRRQVVVGVEDLVRPVGLVPGRHRGVRREDEPLPDRVERLVERASAGHVLCGQFERGERRVALVQVVDGRFDPQRLERSDRTDPEQRVLREADRPVSLVEARGRPAAHGIVLGQLRVDQVERHPADLDAPDVEMRLAAENVHREPQRPPVGAVHPRHRQAARIVLDPVLLLAPVQVEPLAEVATPVEEADGDKR